MLDGSGFGPYPIVAAPGVPVERIKILREAFGLTLKTPEFWKKQRKINGKSDPWAAMNWTLWQRSCQTFSRSDRTAEIIVGGLAGATSA
jgi:hypothetical protein